MSVSSQNRKRLREERKSERPPLLSEWQKQRIRRLWGEGDTTKRELGRQFGVSDRVIASALEEA